MSTVVVHAHIILQQTMLSCPAKGALRRTFFFLSELGPAVLFSGTCFQCERLLTKHHKMKNDQWTYSECTHYYCENKQQLLYDVDRRSVPGYRYLHPNAHGKDLPSWYIF